MSGHYMVAMTQDARALPYTELAMRVLAAQSIDVLRALQPGLSKRSIAKAVAELHRIGRSDLADACEEAFLNGGRRGKPPPKPGETRRYRVQATAGQDFIRIPTGCLHRSQGQYVDVIFGDGWLRALPAPETDTDAPPAHAS